MSHLHGLHVLQADAEALQVDGLALHDGVRAVRAGAARGEVRHQQDEARHRVPHLPGGLHSAAAVPREPAAMSAASVWPHT